ncbi:DUF1903-domain-containing protein [Ophiobolus disseminans]|uniref:Cx9C motif-containing protein 4, mitochondrial n=1 Tax=Ophiobolus disseminans TaxID=1469910 RepID=A0A6A7A951_9PLEO|nr:DUF1903-domain-containing protein [Ophiobolus disseminans]
MGELEKDVKTNPPCHPRACAIQNCLQKNGFDEARCQKQVDALYECCNAFYKAQGEDASTVEDETARARYQLILVIFHGNVCIMSVLVSCTTMLYWLVVLVVLNHTNRGTSTHF